MRHWWSGVVKDPLTLRWATFDDPPPHASGKTLVCGHTSQPSGHPRTVGHAVGIDTWAHGRTGWLTALDTATGHLWQTNQRGGLRTGWIDDYLGR